MSVSVKVQGINRIVYKKMYEMVDGDVGIIDNLKNSPLIKEYEGEVVFCAYNKVFGLNNKGRVWNLDNHQPWHRIKMLSKGSKVTLKVE